MKTLKSGKVRYKYRGEQYFLYELDPNNLLSLSTALQYHLSK